MAGSVSPLDVRSLVPFRPVRTAGIAFGGSLLILLCAAWLLPASVGKGLGLLTRVPSRFEGAVVSDEPLIGDVRISYRYPRVHQAAAAGGGGLDRGHRGGARDRR